MPEGRRVIGASFGLSKLPSQKPAQRRGGLGDPVPPGPRPRGSLNALVRRGNLAAAYFSTTTEDRVLTLAFTRSSRTKGMIVCALDKATTLALRVVRTRFPAVLEWHETCRVVEEIECETAAPRFARLGVYFCLNDYLIIGRRAPYHQQKR